MSKNAETLEAVKAAEPDGTISLTKRLIGMGGVVCDLVDIITDDDGNPVRKVYELDVRRAVLLAVQRGSRIAAENKQLSDGEQIRCWILGNAVANEENTGYSFTPEDIVLVKKLAKLVFPGVEPYCPLMAVICPSALESK